MPDHSLRGRASSRVRAPTYGHRRGRDARGPLPAPRSLGFGPLAGMCRAVGDERRLRLFQQIAGQGPGGVEAADVDDPEAVQILVACGLITPVRLAGRLHYRAELGQLVEALARLLSR